MQSKARLPSISELFARSYSTVRTRFKALFAAIGITVALSGVFAAIEPFIQGWIGAIRHGAGGGAALGVALLFMMSAFVLAIFQFYSAAVVVKYVINGDPRPEALGAAYRQTGLLFISFVWMMILQSLIAFGAGILLVVPAIILGVYFSLAGFVLLDGRAKGISALSYSARLVQGYWWAVFGRTLLVSILNSAASWAVAAVILSIIYAISGGGSVKAFLLASHDLRALAYQVGSIVPAMFLVAYMAEIYRSLISIKEAASESPLAPERVQALKGPFIGMAIWGLVSGILLTVIMFAIVVISALSVARDRAAALAGDSGKAADSFEPR